MYSCENNYLNNIENKRILSVLKNKFPWYLSGNDSFLSHIVVFDDKMVSTFYDLIEPFQKKIKKQINQAVFYMILNDSTSKKIIDNSEDMYKENNFLKLIYHIDSSDGYTEICSQEKIPHTQNRSIIIDNQLNTGEFNPIKSRTSLILKLLFKK